MNPGESCSRRADLNRSQRCLEAASEAQLCVCVCGGFSIVWRSTRTALSLSLSERLEGNWHAAPHLLRTSFFLVSSSSDQSVRLWRQFDGELVAVLSRSYQPALGNTSSACGAESEGRSGHHGESSSLSCLLFSL